MNIELHESRGACPAPSVVFTAYEPSYWRGLLCTLSSLIRRSSIPLRIDILIRRENFGDLAKRLTYLRHHTEGAQDVRMVMVPDEIVQACDKLSYSAHFKAEICYRLFYFDVIAPKGNALYIDSDTIIQSDIASFGRHLSPTKAFSARESKPSDAFARFATLNGKCPRYLNSGVILFNVVDYAQVIVERMREAQKVLFDISSWSSYLDQDALSLALASEWQELPVTMNFTTPDIESHTDIAVEIFHATGSRKPWAAFGHQPFAALYHQEMRALKIPFIRRNDFTWPLKAASRRLREKILRADIG